MPTFKVPVKLSLQRYEDILVQANTAEEAVSKLEEDMPLLQLLLEEELRIEIKGKVKEVKNTE